MKNVFQRLLIFGWLSLIIIGCQTPLVTQESAIPFNDNQIHEFIKNQENRLKNEELEAVEHYWLALAYYKIERYIEAEREVKRATQMNPISGIYFELYGDIALKTKRYSEALHGFGNAIRLQPELISPYLKLALIHDQIGETERAVEALEEVLQREPKYVEALFHLSRMHLKLRAYEDAMRSLRLALDLEPDNKEILLLHIKIHRSQKNYYHSEILLNELMEKYPDYYPALNEKLKILFAMQEWDEAEQWIKKMKDKNKFKVEDQLIQVKISIEKKQINRAKKLLKEILEKDKKCVDAMMDFALLHLQDGMILSAMKWLNRIIEINSRIPRTHYLQALIYFKQGNLLQGDLSINKAIELDPQNNSYQLLLLRRKLHKGDLRSVETGLNKLMTELPLEPEILRIRADMHVFKKEYEKAEKLLKQIQIIRDSDIIRFSLARVFYLRGNTHSVLFYTQPLMEKYPQHWEIHYLHASTLSRLGKWKKAIMILKPFVKEKKGNGLIHRLLGDIYQYQGMEKKSEEIYELGLIQFPNHPYLVEALSSYYAKKNAWKSVSDLILPALEQETSLHRILLNRLVLSLYQQGEKQKARQFFQMYYQDIDPILNPQVLETNQSFIYPIASPIIGFSELDMYSK